MIIVSQDGNITDFNKLTEIYKTFGNEKSIKIEAEKINDGYVNLGEYDTKERADEILKEMTEYYKKFEYCKQITIGQKYDDTRKNELGVYEMPKE